MLFRAIRAECMKLKRSMIFWAVVMLPLLAVGIGSFNYLGNLGLLKDGWYSLWTQVCLFYNYFFFPPLMGVLASYLCRLEHLGNWNSILCAPLPRGVLFVAKLSVLVMLAALVQALLGGLYIAAGCAMGLGAPPSELTRWLGYGLLASVCVCAVQLCISLRIKSFAAPVAVALCCGIAGLMMLSQGWGLFFPYSLISQAMSANDPRAPMEASARNGLFVSSFAFACLFAMVGVRQLSRMEMSK